MSDAAPAYRLRDELQGTLAEHPDYPHEPGDEHADMPVFQGASITGAEGVTWQIEELIAERDDGIIVTDDQDVINALENCPAVVRCEAPEPPLYDALTIPKLLELPRAADLPNAGRGLKKPQVVAGLTALDAGADADGVLSAINDAEEV